jgi:hypothetical protein
VERHGTGISRGTSSDVPAGARAARPRRTVLRRQQVTGFDAKSYTEMHDGEPKVGAPSKVLLTRMVEVSRRFSDHRGDPVVFAEIRESRMRRNAVPLALTATASPLDEPLASPALTSEFIAQIDPAPIAMP